jgi:hypothetical protein
MPKRDCKDEWDKIPDDEPIFILRGKDLNTPEAIAEWLFWAREKDVNQGKIESVQARLDEIEDFHCVHPERCKNPD